jgi:hypothetical protein
MIFTSSDKTRFLAPKEQGNDELRAKGTDARDLRPPQQYD